MLSGKIGRALEPSPQCLARHLGKQQRQDQGDDRGEHRGASRAPAGNRFLTVLIAGACWQLIASHSKRKTGVKVGVNA